MNKSLRHIASIISPYTRGENAFLSSLAILKRKRRSAPIPELFNTIKALAPGLKVISQVRAGRTIYLPAYLTEKSATYHALRWSLAKDGFHPKISWAQRLTTNLLEASQKTGMAYKAKKELNASVLQSRINYRPRFRFPGKRRKPKKTKGRIPYVRPIKVKRIKRIKRRVPYVRRMKKISMLKKRPSIVNLSYLTDKIPPHIVASFKRKKRRMQLKLAKASKGFKNFKSSRQNTLKLRLKKRKLITKRLDKSMLENGNPLFKGYVPLKPEKEALLNELKTLRKIIFKQTKNKKH